MNSVSRSVLGEIKAELTVVSDIDDFKDFRARSHKIPLFWLLCKERWSGDPLCFFLILAKCIVSERKHGENIIGVGVAMRCTVRKLAFVDP